MNRLAFTVLLFLLATVLSLGAQSRDYADNKKAVLYLGDPAPVIDGNFDEWKGLQGSTTRTVVYGGAHDPKDAEGFFILRSSGNRLYIYARVTDDQANQNDLPAPIAWRNDSVEVYIGIQGGGRNRFAKDDSHIRIVPVSKTDPKAFKIAINDREVSSGPSAAVKYHADGYEIEASIPLNMLMIKGFSINQNIRVEFQVNDADRTERDRLLHWSSPRDDTYHNPGSWGDGVVKPLQ